MSKDWTNDWPSELKPKKEVREIELRILQILLSHVIGGSDRQLREAEIILRKAIRGEEIDIEQIRGEEK